VTFGSLCENGFKDIKIPVSFDAGIFLCGTSPAIQDSKPPFYLTPKMTTLASIRGFSYFVTAMTAPIASGWRKITGWDSHPLENAAFARHTP